MKFVAVLSPVFLRSCMSLSSPQSAPAGSAPPAAPEKLLTLYVGGRSLSSDWTPVEDQATFQVEYSREDPSDDVGWEVGLAGSSDSSADSSFGPVDVTGPTGRNLRRRAQELRRRDRAPVRRRGALDHPRSRTRSAASSTRTHPRPGTCTAESNSSSARPSSIGLDLRGLFGSDITIAGANGDADYTQAALTFGWRF